MGCYVQVESGEDDPMRLLNLIPRLKLTLLRVLVPGCQVQLKAVDSRLTLTCDSPLATSCPCACLLELWKANRERRWRIAGFGANAGVLALLLLGGYTRQDMIVVLALTILALSMLVIPNRLRPDHCQPHACALLRAAQRLEILSFGINLGLVGDHQLHHFFG